MSGTSSTATINDEETLIDYDSNTIPQLKKMLDEQGIPYKSGLLKAEYIKLLEGGET